MKIFVEDVFPTINTKAKTILIIVGFIYKNIGLLKYRDNPPNIEITIPPVKGI